VIGATIDSSVYIRALHFGGPAALLIGYARAGKIRIDISDPILNETLRVLRDKFGWSGDMLHDARGKLEKLANRVTPTETLYIIEEDPDDNRIL
jgi:predicted nucleic acid-binding protein